MRLPGQSASDSYRMRESLTQIVDHGMDILQEVTRTLVQRQTSSTASSISSSTCKPGDNSAICQKPTDSGSTQILPIALGAGIPLSAALIVLFFLHRRLRRKQRIEDANDKHKSLDFGMEISGPSRTGKPKGGRHEMMDTGFGDVDPRRPGTHGRGMSLEDMDVASPYLLPAGLHGSRGSIHSMSRSMHDENDPYRPVALLRSPDDTAQPRHDNASMYSAASSGKLSSNEKSNLLVNAQVVSHSQPRRGDSTSPLYAEDAPSTRHLHSNRSIPPSRKTSLSSGEQPPLAHIMENNSRGPVNLSDMKNLPPPPPPPESAYATEQVRPPRTSSAPAPRPPRKSSASPSATSQHYGGGAGDYYQPTVPMPVSQIKESYYEDTSYDDDPSIAYDGGRYSIDTEAPSQRYPVQQQTMPVMGVRPLPPQYPEDNPEVRANRIRSFYKEYFDDSRPNPAHGQYEEQYYDQEQYYDPGFADGVMYDPHSGGYATSNKPWAQPLPRRAMTPPPRGAPRGGDSPHQHHRQYSTMSAGREQPRGRSGPPPMPRPRAPPPKPLQGLPTPHKLMYDGVISAPIDFAPPSSYRQIQNGRGSSPGVDQPYSPTVRAFRPLVSAYEELPVMPSPHLLRKSGTFTTLDFARPPRIKDPGDGTASDAGSIRSARSGISAVQMDAVRAGAYRVSRIPRDVVTTREDLAMQLRPKMNLISPG